MPNNRDTCGIAVLKSTVKTTVLVPYKNGTSVPQWYRATLVYTIFVFNQATQANMTWPALLPDDVF